MNVKQQRIVELVCSSQTREVINGLKWRTFEFNVEQGWYTDPKTGNRIGRNVGEMLMLIVSEIAEAMEGFRKELMDDHLPRRSMLEVELADALIRILDLAGYLGLDLGGAFVDKFQYNANRADHKLENRAKENGKKF